MIHGRTLFCLIALVVAFMTIFAGDPRLANYQEAPSRAPFSLELPDINRSAITSLEVHVAKTGIHTLKLHIAQPFADQIEYDKIYTVVNAESANTIQTVTSALRGKVVTLDLESKQRFQLQPGKNVVEISATDNQQKQYYASFVIIADSSETKTRSAASPALSYDFTGRKFALVVGVSQYKFHEGGLNDLRYADADARSIADFLKSRAGFQESDVTYLENEKATAEGVRAALQLFLPRARASDLVFLFIASHGAQDRFDPKNIYLILHDSKVSDLPRTAIKMSDLQDLFTQRLHARQMIILIDACHSGAVTVQQRATGRQLERQDNNTFSLYAEKLLQQEGRAVLTSSDVNEISEEGDNWGGGHGVFTWSILEGLRGPADSNHDKVVTTGELFDFVSREVRAQTSSRQNPRVPLGTTRSFPISRAAQ